MTVQAGDDRNEYRVSILLELPIEPVNVTEITQLQDYFNTPAPYGRVSKISKAVLTVFEPNGKVTKSVIIIIIVFLFI